jgi:ABC-type antimicrobial peptide transport system permease subunit
MALGANRSHIVRMVLRDAAILLAISLAAGMAMTIAAGNAAASMLYGLEPRDPMTLAIAIVGNCRGWAGSKASCRRSAPRTSIPWQPCVRNDVLDYRCKAVFGFSRPSAFR